MTGRFRSRFFVLLAAAVALGGSVVGGVPTPSRADGPGDVDLTFDPGDGGVQVKQVVVQQLDHNILVAGSFTWFGGVPRPGIARLNPDGTLDNTFGPPLGSGSVIESMALQPDGKIPLGGVVQDAPGSSRHLVRLNADGSLDTGFLANPGPNGSVEAITLDPRSGKIAIGGHFTSYDGTSREHVARLNQDGSLDTTFRPHCDDYPLDLVGGPNGPVFALVVTSDGSIIVGGDFDVVAELWQGNVARFHSDGHLNPNWNGGALPFRTDGPVHSLALQPDGKVLLGGAFTRHDDYVVNSNIIRSISTAPWTSRSTPTSGVSARTGRFPRWRCSRTAPS